jgi:uncharacterized membrane protein YvbJ
MFIFPRVSDSNETGEGNCPKCGKTVRINEFKCPYCIYQFNDTELAYIKKQAANLEQESKSYEIIWWVAVVAIFATSLYFWI